MKKALFTGVGAVLFLAACATQGTDIKSEKFVEAGAVVKAVSQQEIDSASNELILKNSKQLAEIEAYLNGIQYLKTSFEQISPDGQSINGKFYLSRPGKIKIDYTPAMQVIIVVNGLLVTYQDLELEEISHISSDAVPTTFLARKHISFSDKDVVLKNFEEYDDSYRVTVAQGDREENGEFTLIFGRNPLKLERLEVKDMMDSVTRLRFYDSVFGEKISEGEFKVKDPRLPE